MNWLLIREKLDRLIKREKLRVCIGDERAKFIMRMKEYFDTEQNNFIQNISNSIHHAHEIGIENQRLKKKISQLEKDLQSHINLSKVS